MSIEALRWALQIGEEKNLAPTVRHVLLILGNRADEQGYLYPSVAWICARTGLSRRSVQVQLKAISEAGLLQRDTRQNDSGVRTSDSFQLTINQPGLFTEFGGADSAPPRARAARGGRSSCTGGGAPGAPYTQDIKQEEKKARRQAAFPLPDWMPTEAWTAWLEVRTKKKVPNTTRALQIAVGKLEALKAEGFAPEKVLDCAIEKGWRGIYKPTELSTPQTANKWWETDSGMEAMAKQHGVSTLGKTRWQLKAAIEEKLQQGRTH
jgi:hypothetical protein